MRIPNPAARSATARPIEPRPTMPRVLPSSPLALLYVAFAQRPRRASATLSAILRSRARISPMASSATATALRPGTLQTSTPFRAATSVSMVLVPAPARITRPSLSAASNTARSTLVLRTTSPSMPAIRPGSSAVVRAGSTEQ